MKFTKYQKEELLALLDIRLETIQKDSSSADDFETEESLEVLRQKIESLNPTFTEVEKRWIIEECKCRQEIGHNNMDHEGIKVFGLINSMQDIVDKLQS